MSDVLFVLDLLRIVSCVAALLGGLGYLVLAVLSLSLGGGNLPSSFSFGLLFSIAFCGMLLAVLLEAIV